MLTTQPLSSKSGASASETPFDGGVGAPGRVGVKVGVRVDVGVTLGAVVRVAGGSGWAGVTGA